MTESTPGRVVSPDLERALGRIHDMAADLEARQEGTARQQMWEAEDGWLISYTTSRIWGGPMHGKFATLVYKPIGGERFERVYNRAFSKRKMAKERAEALYAKHSPKWARLNS